MKEETDAAIAKAAEEKAERENHPPMDHSHRQPQRRKPSNKPTRQRSRHR